MIRGLSQGKVSPLGIILLINITTLHGVAIYWTRDSCQKCKLYLLVLFWRYLFSCSHKKSSKTTTLDNCKIATSELVICIFQKLHTYMTEYDNIESEGYYYCLSLEWKPSIISNVQQETAAILNGTILFVNKTSVEKQKQIFKSFKLA